MNAYDSVHEAREGVSARFRTTLKDASDTPIEPATISSMNGTLMSLDDVDQDGQPAIVNSRSGVDVLNNNGATIIAGGVFTWDFQAADMQMIDEKRTVERHLLKLVVAYSGKIGITRHMILVHNMERT